MQLLKGSNMVKKRWRCLEISLVKDVALWHITLDLAITSG